MPNENQQYEDDQHRQNKSKQSPQCTQQQQPPPIMLEKNQCRLRYSPKNQIPQIPRFISIVIRPLRKKRKSRQSRQYRQYRQFHQFRQFQKNENKINLIGSRNNYNNNDIISCYQQTEELEQEQKTKFKLNAILSRINEKNQIRGKSNTSKISNIMTINDGKVLLFRRYKLIKRIGVGTFAAVWKIIDIKHSNNTEYALKIIKNDKKFNAEKRKKYQNALIREARKIMYLNKVSTKEIGKEFIIKFSGFIEGGSSPFGPALLLEVGPKSLHHLITFHRNRNLEISMNTIRIICIQIFFTMSFLHGIGNTIHCDLKPRNILIDIDEPNDKNPRIKIIDFGNALWYNTKINSFNIQTLSYRAPELLFGHKQYISSPIDMWSIGCILYELFTVGHRLFVSSNLNPADIAYKISQNYSAFNQYVYNKYTSYHFNDIFKRLRRSSFYYNDWKESFFYDNDIIDDESSYFLLKEKRKNKLIDIINIGDSKGVDNKQSMDLIDLLSCLLDLNPLTRYNSEDSLRHPFITPSSIHSEKQIKRQHPYIKWSSDSGRQRRMEQQKRDYYLLINKMTQSIHLSAPQTIIKKHLY